LPCAATHERLGIGFDIEDTSAIAADAGHKPPLHRSEFAKKRSDGDVAGGCHGAACLHIVHHAPFLDGRRAEDLRVDATRGD